MNEFDPEYLLLKLSKHPDDQWTVDDAMKGVSIMGGTGSGKTSASGRAIALSFLKAGWGGVVLCAKSDEAELWLKYAKESHREKDVLIFGKNSKHSEEEPVPEYLRPYQGQTMIFNPIDYELNRSGERAGETQNLTNIFMNIYKMGSRISGGGESRDDRFWDSALKRCLNRTIELLKMAKQPLSYSNLVKVVSSCTNLVESKLVEELARLKSDGYIAIDTAFNNYCGRCILDAYYYNILDKTEEVDEAWEMFELVSQYFVRDLISMGDKTGATIIESFMALAEPFLSGILAKHFSAKTNVFPEWTYEHQKIIILDFPIKEFLDSGIVSQSIFKLMFQQAVERRNTDSHPIPVFLWCDEAQYFINPYDQIFLTTARSSRTSTVYLSQNISNYFAVMSKGQGESSAVNSLMGNLSTKIFHANSDAATNEYASRLIGNTVSLLAGASDSINNFGFSTSHSESVSSSYHPQVQPKEFTTLKTGGKGKNNFQVQAMLIEAGREWADEKNYLKIVFKQKFDDESEAKAGGSSNPEI